MNISEKIEEIRRQPEHIRMRYVWGGVTVSMLVILAIWIFSVASMFGKEKNNPVREVGDNLADIQQKLQNLKQQAPSLGGLDGPSSDAAEGDAARPLSDTYSDLSGNDAQQ